MLRAMHPVLERHAAEATASYRQQPSECFARSVAEYAGRTRTSAQGQLLAFAGAGGVVLLALWLVLLRPLGRAV